MRRALPPRRFVPQRFVHTTAYSLDTRARFAHHPQPAFVFRISCSRLFFSLVRLVRHTTRPPRDRTITAALPLRSHTLRTQPLSAALAPFPLCFRIVRRSEQHKSNNNSNEMTASSLVFAITHQSSLASEECSLNAHSFTQHFVLKNKTFALDVALVDNTAAASASAATTSARSKQQQYALSAVLHYAGDAPAGGALGKAVDAIARAPLTYKSHRLPSAAANSWQWRLECSIGILSSQHEDQSFVVQLEVLDAATLTSLVVDTDADGHPIPLRTWSQPIKVISKPSVVRKQLASHAKRVALAADPLAAMAAASLKRKPRGPHRGGIAKLLAVDDGAGSVVATVAASAQAAVAAVATTAAATTTATTTRSAPVTSTRTSTRTRRTRARKHYRDADDADDAEDDDDDDYSDSDFTAPSADDVVDDADDRSTRARNVGVVVDAASSSSQSQSQSQSLFSMLEQIRQQQEQQHSMLAALLQQQQQQQQPPQQQQQRQQQASNSSSASPRQQTFFTAFSAMLKAFAELPAAERASALHCAVEQALSNGDTAARELVDTLSVSTMRTPTAPALMPCDPAVCARTPASVDTHPCDTTAHVDSPVGSDFFDADADAANVEDDDYDDDDKDDRAAMLRRTAAACAHSPSDASSSSSCGSLDEQVHCVSEFARELDMSWASFINGTAAAADVAVTTTTAAGAPGVRCW